MNFLIKILELLNLRMTEPKPYGAFHLIAFALAIVLGAFLCWKFKDPSEKTIKRILLIFSLTVIALEIYKQVVVLTLLI